MVLHTLLSGAAVLVSNPFLVAFWLGLLTPLTAVCVLPMYPGFLSYLSHEFSGGERRRTVFLFGLLAVAGVISSMMLVGIVLTTVLEVSLTSSIGMITPVAMGILAVIGIVLLLDVDIARYVPSGELPEPENPILNAFGFGFFFGGVVLPCNPGFIAVLFARSALFETPVTNILRSTSFGLGMGFPLLVFSLISGQWSDRVLGGLKRYSTPINRFTGAIILAVALYYLSCPFGLIPVLSFLCP